MIPPDTNLIDPFESDDGKGSWILTFADMMTLILVFFIMLYALSQYKEEEFRAEISKISVIDGDGKQVSVIDYAAKTGRDPEPLKAIEDMLGLNPSPDVIDTVQPKVLKDLESMVKYSELTDTIELQQAGDQINLSIDGRFLFASGKADLKDSAKVIFSNLTVIFRENSDYRIAIRGHTDDLDINTVQFPSNWELSAVRATTVLRYFIAQGLDPVRMTATGYADFLPIVPNNSVENRARNRRVEFVLEKETDI